MLRNEEIQLRAIEPEDLNILYKWENDTSLWIHGSTLAPYSKQTVKQYIEDSQMYDISQSGQLRLIICLADETVVGAIDIYDIDFHARRAGVGILIDPTYRGKGLAVPSLELLHEYCFDFLNLHQLYAHISVENEQSLKIFESTGYVSVGTLKDWIYNPGGFKDVVLVQKINTKDE